MSYVKSHRLVTRHQSSISRLAEDFFWIGGSIVTPATWRLGQFVERCMSLMQSGTQMVKLRGSSKGLVRFYYLDEHKTCIRWRPSRKNEKAKISIDAIREVCEGKQSEIFQRYPEGSFDPNCCFSIYYGDHMESLDLVSSNGEEARTWITGLKYLMAGISDEDSLSKRQRTRDQWLKQTFAEADKNGDGCLSVGEVLQLMHKLNVNLPRQKVKQMFKEADTDENQGTLDFEEFCAFYKMMSTRRDLYLLMLMYSNHKDQLDSDDLKRFLEVEQKMTNVTKEHCLEIIDKFEPCPENRKQGVLGIDGFTNYMRSPAGDIFNPEHYKVSQDMTQPMCNYYIASSHNTYLMGDQLMSQSRVDMYAWVLQTGCRCVEVDCWDGPDGEPIVHHGYTLTSKILFRDVIETINKYAFAKSEYPVILSIENHCSVPQQKKMAQYLCEILGDKLDVSSVHVDDVTQLPSPDSLKGKILVKGKKLPANISDDAEEGEVSDEDSADEIEDDCKLMNGDWKAVANRKHVESVAKKKLDSLLKESKIRDREDPDSFSVNAIPQAGKLCQKSDSKKKCRDVHILTPGSTSAVEKSVSKAEDGTDSGEDLTTNKRHSRSFIGSFSKRKKKTVKMKKSSSLEDDEEDHDHQASACRSTVHVMRSSRQKKTMKLSRALSDLVKYTKSVGMYDIDSEVSCSWQVSSYSETKTHQLLQQKPQQFVRMNQQQLSRIYPSSYRVDSSNFNPQPFWNAGCQLVALNYQSEGRVLQLNRAKFSSNGSCGYVLKPKCMTQGNFNPTAEDLLSGQPKKQLVLRIISGQQLPKPKDSMLGDRGEIIDPFVEVEIIGLAVDCFKEQTRVVDDNGFNPMWEETLVFTLNMPELALVRFLVWDHDPIGRDFIGQRTLAFTSMMPGYRHVYLEGMEEASIFVHVVINDISGKIKQVMGLKGLFHRNPKQASLDSHVAGLLTRKPSFSSQILRRTASAPTKGQPKSKKGFPQIVLDTKDYSSEGASESDDTSQPRFEQDAGCAETALEGADKAGTDGEVQTEAFKGVQPFSHPVPSIPMHTLETITEESMHLEDRTCTDSQQMPPSIVSSSGEETTNSEESLVLESSPPSLKQMKIITNNNRAIKTPEVSCSEEQLENGSDCLGKDLLKGGNICLALNLHEDSQDDDGASQFSDGNASSCTSIDHSETTMSSSQSPKDPSLASDGQGKEKAGILSDHPSQLDVLPTGCSSSNSVQEMSGERSDSTELAESQKCPTFDLFPSSPSQAAPNGCDKNAPGCLVRINVHPDIARSTSCDGRLIQSQQTFVVTPIQLCTSPVPVVSSDVTINDRIWCKLDSGNHRDSMSSSSSMSSNDTVIDLSLPNLARKSLSDLSSRQSETLEGLVIDKRVRPRSATTSHEILTQVSKSKSNPNLRSDGDQQQIDDLQPKPLGKSLPTPCQPSSRRHTWSRLYMESLKQSSPTLKSITQSKKVADSPSKSKSLGDLTSDDIVPSFDSKYKSISRTFITRPMREQRRAAGMKRFDQDNLTEQLKRITSFERENDITSPTAGQPPETEDSSPVVLRRSSSRSQSRVRYIANRAKQAQERLRLQNLGQGNPPSMLEERGNPEGACCDAKSICTDVALPYPDPNEVKVPKTADNEAAVFFMLKL
ncbi:1-phosphatidylinositol 4,5-bisphosphate phosphodiesterase eta-2a isoform X2 [Chiloscyllium plagiosum]|uniref:1-phosphatidylinositol 4,5-bisphosphate phosphodiesterase eta-2a isoform X2 n=1 Tax=Chiloscyllium plagiosum TaxID=36176 RepID=UPI001CB83029|nr:1-phosphatidylinositol 4,5-bisphosphate phosphodiesterase eta-2a isoform X2 [Chiloscyllium plagiosum]